jgi:hypothetical protein
MSDLPFPEFSFLYFFPGRAKRRGPNRREGRGRPVWRKRPRARFWVWELCEEARAAAYMEAPRRVPSREQGPSRPGLSLRCAQQRRSTRVRPYTEIQTVSGRMKISAGQWSQCDFVEAEIAYDVWHVDNIYFSLDAKTFWLTILKVLSRADITPPGMKSMPAFRGRSDDK